MTNNEVVSRVLGVAEAFDALRLSGALAAATCALDNRSLPSRFNLVPASAAARQVVVGLARASAFDT